MSLFGEPKERQTEPFERLEKEVRKLASRMARAQETLGRVEARQCAAATTMAESEFRAFSQWGEDGIIQFLLRKVKVPRKFFVEFGVENYTEANTRFLLVNDNWPGLVMDGSAENIRSIRKSAIYWQHNLKAVEAFVTRENINGLLTENGVCGEIGLLSIDIDGNDYWVWEAIEAVSPAIVVMEYNARFGPTEAVTVPYDPKFTRANAHYSQVYYGASLEALTRLSRSKGYGLAGCNSAGNNAFFIRKDLWPASLPELSAEAAFARNQFREARGEDGKLAFLDFEAEQKLVFSLPLDRV
ncbi:MAG: hypothetical protein ABSE62_09875 [Chthoniobacteraceae bacterium]|jgi:hypothetical protein